jgi:hypothetical protein
MDDGINVQRSGTDHQGRKHDVFSASVPRAAHEKIEDMKYFSKSFQYVSDGSPNKGAIQWLNAHPEVELVAIVAADRYGEGCHVVYKAFEEIF